MSDAQVRGRRTTGAFRHWTARNSNKCRQTSVLIDDPIPFASVRIGRLNAAVIAILPMAGSLNDRPPPSGPSRPTSAEAYPRARNQIAQSLDGASSNGRRASISADISLSPIETWEFVSAEMSVMRSVASRSAVLGTDQPNVRVPVNSPDLPLPPHGELGRSRQATIA